ncbi:hypothetical protein ACF087_35545 [Streptomyces goshikiensis]|uniref:hypothetical protein n=1 Tax=Streptomyces goshikiensis TaxID=1942 RepID=UPI0036FB9B89
MILVRGLETRPLECGLADAIVNATVALSTVTPEAKRALGYRLQQLVVRVVEPQK